MEIEENLLIMYYNFIKDNSLFGEKTLIVPKTPQSFSSFPTIVFKESNNSDYSRGKTTNRQEFINRLTYIVDIYTKDTIVNDTKYNSLEVLKELKLLTYEFFNKLGFNRLSSSRAEFMDITVDRNVSIFEGKVNNWNGKIIL